MQMRQFNIDYNLKELTKHEKTMLPIACYETTIQYHIQGYIPIHWHEELQFVYVKEGTSQFQVNDDQIEVKKGQGLTTANCNIWSIKSFRMLSLLSADDANVSNAICTDIPHSTKFNTFTR